MSRNSNYNKLALFYVKWIFGTWLIYFELVSFGDLLDSLVCTSKILPKEYLSGYWKAFLVSIPGCFNWVSKLCTQDD